MRSKAPRQIAALALGLILLAPGLSVAAPPTEARKPQAAARQWCKAEIVSLPDVDTWYLRIRQPFGGIVLDGPDGRGVKCRIQGFDGWEASRARIQREPFKSFTAAQWAEEIRKGKAATAELAALMKGRQIWVAPYDGPERPVYNRVSVWARVDDIPIEDHAKAHGWDRGGPADEDE